MNSCRICFTNATVIINGIQAITINSRHLFKQHAQFLPPLSPTCSYVVGARARRHQPQHFTQEQGIILTCHSFWVGVRATPPGLPIHIRCIYGLCLHISAATFVEAAWAAQPACGVALDTVRWLQVSRVSQLSQIQQDHQCPGLSHPPQPTCFLSFGRAVFWWLFPHPHPQVPTGPPHTSPHRKGVKGALCLSTSPVHTAVQNSEDQ